MNQPRGFFSGWVCDVARTIAPMGRRSFHFNMYGNAFRYFSRMSSANVSGSAVAPPNLNETSAYVLAPAGTTGKLRAKGYLSLVLGLLVNGIEIKALSIAVGSPSLTNAKVPPENFVNMAGGICLGSATIGIDKEGLVVTTHSEHSGVKNAAIGYSTKTKLDQIELEFKLRGVIRRVFYP